jgi:hypothetical protein
MAAVTKTGRGKGLVSVLQVLQMMLSGPTEQDLQDDRPEVSLFSSWEIRCLPHKIRCLNRVSLG